MPSNRTKAKIPKSKRNITEVSPNSEMTLWRRAIKFLKKIWIVIAFVFALVSGILLWDPFKKTFINTDRENYIFDTMPGAYIS